MVCNVLQVLLGCCEPAPARVKLCLMRACLRLYVIVFVMISDV